jgi:hypothetical protein
MKKFILFPGSLLMVGLMVFALSACQKEQNAATAQTNSVASESTVVGVAGSGKYAGSIQPSYAAALASNFAHEYGTKTVSVAFSAKDLVGFINNLQAKYKSDIIYVNFGRYGEGAPAVNPRDNGRLTVFFTGNNMPTTTGGRRSDGVTADDEFLNHGGLVP